MVSLQSFKFFLRKVLLPAIVKWNGPEDLSNGLTLVPLNGLQQPFPAQRYHKAYAGPYGCQYHRFPYIFQTNLHQQHQQRAAKGSCFQWILCLVHITALFAPPHLRPPPSGSPPKLPCPPQPGTLPLVLLLLVMPPVRSAACR